MKLKEGLGKAKANCGVREETVDAQSRLGLKTGYMEAMNLRLQHVCYSHMVSCWQNSRKESVLEGFTAQGS